VRIEKNKKSDRPNQKSEREEVGQNYSSLRKIANWKKVAGMAECL
jgi:hypothetical protein